MDPDTTTSRRPLWRRVVGSTWFHFAAAFIVTGLVLSFVAKPYWVPSGSMETTLQPGDRVLVNRLAYVGASPGTGDIVVFDAGPTWDIEGAPPSDPIRGVLRWLGEVTGFGPSSAHTLIKRVIGTPGQTVECCTDDGQLIVDGEPLDEPYVTNDLPFEAGELDCDDHSAIARCFDAVEVPADSLSHARRQPRQLVRLGRLLPGRRCRRGRLLAVGDEGRTSSGRPSCCSGRSHGGAVSRPPQQPLLRASRVRRPCTKVASCATLHCGEVHRRRQGHPDVHENDPPAAADPHRAHRARRTELRTTATPVRASDVSTAPEDDPHALADARRRRPYARPSRRAAVAPQRTRAGSERSSARTRPCLPAIDEAASRRAFAPRTPKPPAASQTPATRPRPRTRHRERRRRHRQRHRRPGSRSSRELASGLAQLFG